MVVVVVAVVEVGPLAIVSVRVILIDLVAMKFQHMILRGSVGLDTL